MVGIFNPTGAMHHHDDSIHEVSNGDPSVTSLSDSTKDSHPAEGVQAHLTSEHTPAVASPSQEEASEFKRSSFYSSESRWLLKNKEFPGGKTSDLWQHAGSHFIREKKKTKKTQRAFLLPPPWDGCVEPLKASPLHTPGPLLIPSVAVIVCVAVNIL